ncbi:hypothetical protein [Sphingobacterium sp.]|uniref:hypothetical protein n=1 Tax=Sphingobacterium sp. TaxID=341027 RepID=UPI0028A5E30B|nr:hypothetical protein [Sphingobacterium sp.]
MKKLLLAITGIVMFSSCSKDEVESSGIVGNWKSETSTGYPRFTFASGNTFEWSVSDKITNSGTYRISGSNLFLKSGDEYKFNFTVNGNKLSFNRSDATFEQTFGGSYNLVKE